MWREAGGERFNPGNYYYVGGNSKLYGAVLIRYRKEDFAEMEHFGGVSPAWPFPYDEFEPWYSKAEQLFQRARRARRGPDRAVPFAALRLPAGARRAADRARPRRAEGARPASRIAAARRRHRGVAEGRQDAAGTRFPTPAPARWTPRARRSPRRCRTATSSSSPARMVEPSRSLAGRQVDRGRPLSPERRSRRRSSPKLVILSAGAINSAAILLRSPSPRARASPTRSDQVGRNFMNHNSAAMLAIDPRRRNDSVYQKTLMLNDYYLSDGKGGKPLGNVQLLGKIDGNMLARQREARAEIRARLHGRPRGRLVPDVRGPARSRKPHHGRRRRDRAAVAAHQHAVAGRPDQGDARKPARLRLSDRAVAPLRQAHAVAPVRHGAHGQRSGRRRRSTRSAAPSTTGICSSSMAASCRLRRRSTRR